MTRKGAFQATTPETTKPAMGVDSEAVVDDTILATWDTITLPRAQAPKEQTFKDRNRCRYKPWFTCCRLSQSNKKLSSYSLSKYNIALNKEGYSNPFTSRVHKILQGQLGHTDTRPLGVVNSPGFQITSGCTTSADNCPTTNDVPLRSAVTDIIRGGVTAEEASSNSCATQPGKFHFTDFCGSQKRWGPLPSNKFKSPKQICGGGTLQDGRLPSGEGPSGEQGLDGKDRYEGCLFSSANRSYSPSISPVSLEGDHLPVSLPAIWTFLCPLHIHETDETSSGFPEGEGHQINHISR